MGVDRSMRQPTSARVRTVESMMHHVGDRTPSALFLKRRFSLHDVLYLRRYGGTDETQGDDGFAR